MTKREADRLDAETRALIAAASGMHDPTPEQRLRTFQGLEHKIAAGVAGGGVVFGASVAAAAKTAAVVLAVGAVCGAVWIATRQPAPSSPRASATLHEESPRPPAAESKAPLQRVPPSAAAEPTQSAPAVARAPNPARDVTSLDRETRLLRAVNGAINDRDGPRALRLLERYDRRFARGVLREERDAAEVFALCLAGRNEPGRSASARFAASYPRSPLLTRVNAACAVDAGAHGDRGP